MSKWIRFVDVSERFSEFKTCVWEVLTIAVPNEVIGVVRWYGPWRQYCFIPGDDTVYNAECLEDIADFCRENRQTRKPENND